MRCAASSPVLLSQLRRHRAPVGQQHHQAFHRQHLDGFAQRRARDLQLLAERAFVQLGTRRNLPFHDELAQTRAHLLVQNRAGNGDDVGHGNALLHTKMYRFGAILREEFEEQTD
jgi:hypothetical protein